MDAREPPKRRPKMGSTRPSRDSSSHPAILAGLRSSALVLLFSLFILFGCVWGAHGLTARASPSCGPSSKTSCCQQNLQGCPGCTETNIETCVCQKDSRCCSLSWDSLCVYHATVTCAGNCSARCTNYCNMASTCPGCNNSTNRQCVCSKVAECCTIAWSDRCVRAFINSCGGSAAPTPPAHSTTPPIPILSQSPSPSYIISSPSPSVHVSPTPSVVAIPTLTSSPASHNTTDHNANPSVATGVIIFFVVAACLAASVGGGIALYFWWKRNRAEVIGTPMTNRPYSQLEDEHDDLFEGAEDDEEDLPDPFAEEFAAQKELELDTLPGHGDDAEPSAVVAEAEPSHHTSATNGGSQGHGGGPASILDDDGDDEGIDMFAERG